ncbi:hypothetical protein C0J52_26604, partial [Blattella germanica]
NNFFYLIGSYNTFIIYFYEIFTVNLPQACVLEFSPAGVLLHTDEAVTFKCLWPRQGSNWDFQCVTLYIINLDMHTQGFKYAHTGFQVCIKISLLRLLCHPPSLHSRHLSLLESSSE